MDEQAITTLGGVCQILGVIVVVWDLLAKALYRGTPQRVIVWLRAARQQRRWCVGCCGGPVAA
jgi:hypothetical protein